MTRTLSRRLRWAAVLGLLAAAVPAAAKPTTYRPGFNLFNEKQDVEIGRQSAAEAERQLPLLRDGEVDRYLESVVRRLASRAPGPQFPYQIQALDSRDVNAFALPGGFMYVNRGTIEAAANEAELAGVIAHEMAHVALRHGTHQASRAYLAQAGLSVLGGAIGGQKRGTSQVFSAIGGLGLNALFLKYSREAETQADVVGAQILAGAGYDPESMAVMFDKLQAMQRRQPGRLAQFFSDHPAPAARAARIRREAGEIGPVSRTAEVGGFDQVRDDMRRLGPGAGAPVRMSGRRTGTGATSYPSRPAVAGVELEQPSTRVRSFGTDGGLFSLEYPENWQVFPSEDGHGATVVPEGGLVQTQDGRSGLVCGAVVAHYDPFQESHADGPLALGEATDDIVDQVRRANPYLRPQGPARRTTLDGRRAMNARLLGRSPLTGQLEEVTIYTRALSDEHVLYAVVVVPRGDAAAFEPAFARLVDSLQIDERSVHP